MWKEDEVGLTTCFMQLHELFLNVYMIYALQTGSVIHSGS